jgi:hypothetical protein
VLPDAGLRTWPHCEQYWAVAETGLLQFAHNRANGIAHASQNFASAGFSCWHFGHFIFGPGK